MTDTRRYNASFDGGEFDKLWQALTEAGAKNPERDIALAIKNPQSWLHDLVNYTLTHEGDGVFTLAVNNLVV